MYVHLYKPALYRCGQYNCVGFFLRSCRICIMWLNVSNIPEAFYFLHNFYTSHGRLFSCVL